MFGRRTPDARRVGFLVIALFSMMALCGLHATPSLAAAPKSTGLPTVEQRLAALEATVSAQATKIQALESASNTGQSAQITALQTTVTAQAAKISALENTVTAQQAKLAPISVSGSVLTISGVNVRIVDGTNNTQSTSGLGNLTIGYNLSRGISGVDTRTGSHNLILGDYNSYGGLVAGYYNSISDLYASVSGGNNNTAIGQFASVSGGGNNTASGQASSVSGGGNNTASGQASSVSGGRNNTASGDYSYAPSTPGPQGVPRLQGPIGTF